MLTPVPVKGNSTTEPERLGPGVIALLGDTQRTLPVERVLLRREQNDAERHRLIADLVAAGPSLLVHLGDLVADGSRAADWADFDRLAAPVRAAGIPILPALGNHDYGGAVARVLERGEWGRTAASRQLHDRFPWLAEGRWYDRRHGPLRLLWLDTNFGRMDRARWEEQARWFEARLAEAEADAGTRGVLVFAHHPPFTNSRATADDPHVRRAFVGPFCRSRKTLAFFSGHTHAYERFHEQGKMFIVAGGGGGPRVRLRQGRSRRHQDQIHSSSPRPFHYLLLRVVTGADGTGGANDASSAAAGVEVRTRGMDKGAATTGEIDRFFLRFPDDPAPDAPDRATPGRPSPGAA